MNNYTILTLDIWDTILRRKCHPDEIKLMTSKHLYFKYFYRLNEQYRDIRLLAKIRVECEAEIGQNKSCNNEFDDEYCIYDVFTLLCQKVLDNNTEFKEIVSDLYQYEINSEKNNIYLDTYILQKIKDINYDKIAYISDFYAGHEFIDELLEYVQFPLKFDYKFISCECGYNKRSGRLFDFVLDKLNISPDEQIHIGDNEHSDYKIPKSKGIESVRYLPQEENNKRIFRENEFAIRNKGNINVYFDSILSEMNDTAARTSMFYYTFVLWIMEECVKNGVKKIYYFTREGEFFKRIHDEIAENSYFKDDIPKSYLLEVSRIATFGASLRSVTLDEMMRIWNQYSIQTMKAFFKSVNLEREKVQKFLDIYNVNYDDEIVYPWQDERIQKMFMDKEFIEVFQNNIDELRKDFIEYAATKDLNLEKEETIAIVDIGWRGTIQDNICYLLENKKINGYYLGLIDFLNKQPVNSEKYGFINKCSYGHLLLRYVTPLEMLCNSPNGSVIGYNNNVAIRKNDPCEDIIFERYTGDIQDKIIKYVKVITVQANIHGVASDELSELAYSSIYDMIANPSSDFAEAYFSLKHNEEFGVGKYIDKHTTFKPILMASALVSKKARTKLKQFLENTTWPQGYLTKYRMNTARKIYNKIQEKKKGS